jgi:hypothetical protein
MGLRAVVEVARRADTNPTRRACLPETEPALSAPTCWRLLAASACSRLARASLLLARPKDRPVDTGLVRDSCGRYLPEMVKIPESRRRSKSNARPFFELIEQMETLLTTIELDWPDDMRADAKRRLARIGRALRYAPETSERLLDVS